MSNAIPKKTPGDQPSDKSICRLVLFTDTLGDVNGVSRFIGNVAEQAERFGRALHVLTSTRFTCPDRGNLHNLAPRFSRPMPGYSTLDVVLPPWDRLERVADGLKPTVVHVSTPGPVGMAGRRYALRRGLPLVGTYHTDFPAYVERLLHDDALTWACDRAMRWFYRPFARLFSRSDEYAVALERLGIAPERIERLRPGIDTDAFNPSFRDASGRVWAGIAGARAGSVKALYVGRVSVEKNLPMLTRVWAQVHQAGRAEGIDAQLIVVGDGPYHAAMQDALRGRDAVFAGFRHGVELATIYATSDVFVFPSTTDTLGQVVMEAQGAGLPVIVSDQGGPREVVDEHVTGLVLPAHGAGTENTWAQALLRLVRDADLRRSMGARAAEKIAPMSIRHSFEHFWSVHENVSEKTARAHVPGL